MGTNEPIKVELKEIAPRLASMEKGNPYSVPNGYFKKSALQIRSQISETEVYAMPENYFNEAQKEIFAKIKEKPHRKTLSIFPNRMMLGIAASLLILVCALVWNGQENIGGIDIKGEFADVSLSEDFVFDNLDIYDLDEIVENDNMEISLDEISFSEVEEYLENNIDDSDLAELL